MAELEPVEILTLLPSMDFDMRVSMRSPVVEYFEGAIDPASADADELVKAVHRLMTHADERRRLGANPHFRAHGRLVCGRLQRRRRLPLLPSWRR